MRVELERLLAIEPQTADEAEELASRLESLSDSFFENEKNIIEYRNSLFETATDYLGESASATVEQVNNAKSILDNTFNVIKNGSLSGDGFWSATLLPSISKDKVTKQRAENNKLIKEEKRNALDFHLMLFLSNQSITVLLFCSLVSTKMTMCDNSSLYFLSV